MRDGETWLICFCFVASERLQDFLDQPAVEVNFSPRLSPLTASLSPPLTHTFSQSLITYCLSLTSGFNSNFSFNPTVMLHYAPVSPVCM